jgi:hypothetical protein
VRRGSELDAPDARDVEAPAAGEDAVRVRVRDPRAGGDAPRLQEDRVVAELGPGLDVSAISRAVFGCTMPRTSETAGSSRSGWP